MSYRLRLKTPPVRSQDKMVQWNSGLLLPVVNVLRHVIVGWDERYLVFKPICKVHNYA